MELREGKLQLIPEADRRAVDPPIEVDSAAWSAGGQARLVDQGAAKPGRCATLVGHQYGRAAQAVSIASGTADVSVIPAAFTVFMAFRMARVQQRHDNAEPPADPE
jgi:hypothetical protein